MENIVKIERAADFFNVKDTLECGQIFRFAPYREGFKVYSTDRCAYCYQCGEKSFVECSSDDEAYFENFFDFSRDYNKIYTSALGENVKILSDAARAGKGIRILNQNKTEILFSFIVSQNNNIPRIKGIIERLCAELGEAKTFMGEKYYAFPTVEKMAEMDETFYKSIGLGYRAEYIRRLAISVTQGFDTESLSRLTTAELKKKLLSVYGVGPKVADCVALFGFHRSDSFPVDTWIEKVYREDFEGNIKDRKKIAAWFTSRFKENSGYYQQYLFYYKRLTEKTDLNAWKCE